MPDNQPITDAYFQELSKAAEWSAQLLQGTLPAERQEELNLWLAAHPESHTWLEQLQQKPHLRQLTSSYEAHQAMMDTVLQQIHQQHNLTGYPVVRSLTIRKWYRYAAAILLVSGAAGYYFWTNRLPPKTPELVAVVEHHSNATNNARLILSDGRTILLDTLSAGNIILASGIEVIKTAEGQLKYIAPASPPSSGGAEQYNTLLTPRGKQFEVALPDGTKVWMNAASMLTYPTTFNSRNRQIKLQGEAYFEIAPDRQRPFLIDLEDIQIEVLGTHLNLNGYTEEQIVRATLLQGSLRVHKGSQAQLLHPGQQAVIDERIILEEHPDLAEVMAWKNGLFHFDNQPFSAIMRELSRWYDVDVVYRGKVPDIRLAGEMGRDLSLSQVLDGLRDMKVHLSLTGRTIFIDP